MHSPNIMCAFQKVSKSLYFRNTKTLLWLYLKPSFPTCCSIPVCVILHYPGSIFECLPDGILVQRIHVLKSYCYSYTNSCLYVPHHAFVPSFPGNLFLFFLHSHIVSCYIPMILQLYMLQSYHPHLISWVLAFKATIIFCGIIKSYCLLFK